MLDRFLKPFDEPSYQMVFRLLAMEKAETPILFIEEGREIDSMPLERKAPSGISFILNPKSMDLRLFVPEKESVPILSKLEGKETEKRRLASWKNFFGT